LVQRGEVPADFKPMPDIGAGVMEIWASRHAFVTKTRAIRNADIDLSKMRYAALLEARRDGQ
jgi:phage-related protein